MRAGLKLPRVARFLLPLILLVAVGFAGPCYAQTRPPFRGPGPQRLALLSRGINLNAWFAPWANPAAYADGFGPDEAAFLVKAGFTFVRLPLDPDLLFDRDHPAVFRPAVRFVDTAVRMLLDAGLAVVLDPIHGSSDNARWESALYHDAAFRAAAASYWESLARHYAAFSGDRIFFEIMNEPHLSAREKVDPSWWQGVQAGLAAAIRRGAPSNTIIATGEQWGGIDGLLGLKPLPDSDVVYSFHYYEPMTFTHQGASWTGPVQEELSGLPYPPNPPAIAAAEAAMADPRARAQIARYAKEGWGPDRLRAGVARAADWGRAHAVPVFCGEFGVYRKVAPAADRLRWIGDLRAALEADGIGWSMWDYETDFGIVRFAEPQWRRGPEVDAPCLAALGLDPSASLAGGAGGASGAGKPTLADFVAGKTQLIVFPFTWWERLWTREAGAGLESTVPDPSGAPASLRIEVKGSRDWSLPSGFRIAVREGEHYSLSSKVLCSGALSPGLMFTSRDARGAVLSWDLGSKEAKAVSAGPIDLSTEVTIPPGVATIEPRWAGVGPLVAEFGDFEVRRLDPTAP